MKSWSGSASPSVILNSEVLNLILATFEAARRRVITVHIQRDILIDNLFMNGLHFV
jgi:hypothetical protein